MIAVGVVIAMDDVFSNVIHCFIILSSGATLHAQTAAQAATALEPLAGPAAKYLFALSIVGVGFPS